MNVPEQVDLGTVQEYLAALEATDAAGYEEPILRHPERCRRLVIDSRHGDLMELQQVLSDLGLTHAEYAVLWHVGDTLVVDRGFLATWVADHPPNNVPQPLSVDDCETAISTLMGKGLLIELTEADITADLARWRAETLPISWGVARDREVGDVDFTEAGFHLEATITRLTFPQSSRRPAQGYNDEEAGLIRVFGETEKACQDAVQHLVDRIDQSPWHWSKASVRVDPIRRIGPWWVSRFVKASDGYEMVVRKS